MKKLALILTLMPLIAWAQSQAPTGGPVPTIATQVAGSDGTNLRAIKTAADGTVATSAPSGASANQVQGTAANGAATVGNPVWICGLNGGNCVAVLVDASGRVLLGASGQTIGAISNFPATVDVNSGTVSASTPRSVLATNVAVPTSTGSPSPSNAAGGIQDTGGVGRALAARIFPSSNASDAIAPSATSSAASNLVLKASAGNLYSVQLSTGATSGLLMVFDATSAPADGAVTPKYCVQIAANSSATLNWSGPPASFATGITAVFSSGTNCFSKTASATAFISGQVQ